MEQKNPPRTSLYDIEAMRKPAEKEPKTKFTALLGRKQKRTVQKSQRETLISKMLRNKTAKTAKTALADAGYSTTPLELPYFEAIYSSKSKVSTIPIARNLITKPIEIHSYAQIKSDFLTSDLLYWTYQAWLHTENKSFQPFVNLKSVAVCSLSEISLEKSNPIKEYYVEDFQTALSSPAWIKNADLTLSATQNTFLYNNEKVTVFTTKPDNIQCFVVGTIKEEAIKDALNKAILIETKTDLTIGIKQTQKAGNFYIQTSIFPTNFCPSTIKLGTEVEFAVLFTFTIDPDEFVNLIRQGKLVQIPPEIISWPHLSSSASLAALIALTLGSVGANKEVIDIFRNFYDTYVTVKQIAGVYKRLYAQFERIVIQFVDSFNVRINTDKMESILKLANSFLAETDAVIADKIYSAAMQKLFPETMATSARRFLQLDIRKIISSIKFCCEKIMTPSHDSSSIKQYVYATATEIYKLFPFTTDWIIPKLRSPYSVLGLVTGGMDEQTLNSIITQIQEDMLMKSEHLEILEKKEKQFKLDVVNKVIENLKAKGIAIADDIVKNQPALLDEKN